jgi:hypothetical protein
MRPDVLQPRRASDPSEKGEPRGQVVRLDPSVRARRIDHPSVPAGRTGRHIVLSPLPEPTLTFDDTDLLVDLSECSNGCGRGARCEACRAEIRAEALKWLRELNVPRPTSGKDALSWTRAWHQDILLADH